MSVLSTPRTLLTVPRGSRLVAFLPGVAGIGLAVVAVAFYLNRTGRAARWTECLFWVGFLVVLVPIVVAALNPALRRGDRVAVAVIFSVSAYAIKLFRDPMTFVMSDEFTHLSATQRIVETHALTPSAVISDAAVAADYPGLHVVTALLSGASGLSLFVSGLIVIGFARVLMTLALFHLSERLTSSAFVGGLVAILFAANTNFLYWSSQYSYESLALPLFVVALYLLTARAEGFLPRTYAGIATAGLVVTITATHHVTTYALAATLLTLTALAIVGRWRTWTAPLHALLAVGLSVLWFFVVAPGTGAYLGYVFGNASSSITHLLARRSVHTPFASGAGNLNTPPIEQLVAFAGIAVVGIGFLVSLVGERRSLVSRSPLILLFAFAGIACLFSYPLRLLPAAWETANRAQEFLFIGIAFVLAVGVRALRERAGSCTLVRLGLPFCAVLAICGGVIDGWPAPLRLADPLFIKESQGHAFAPQNYGTAVWAARTLPADSRYAADQTTANELGVLHAGHVFFAKPGGDFAQILQNRGPLARVAA